jgi:hypothetical protein
MYIVILRKWRVYGIRIVALFGQISAQTLAKKPAAYHI